MNEGILAEFAAFSGEDVGCVVPLGAEEGYEGTEEIAGWRSIHHPSYKLVFPTQSQSTYSFEHRGRPR